ncbi:MAG: indolepyruvate ferredoxin oxidoreductase subunit alpha [Deltaproteobacteria bacterium]|nr:indolepyruvate ferredoxin oxidoreductase subunit alpha [Deltaproteobacteria bacterium]
MKKLLTGNEAIARGAWEAGVKFASAYPGTPSTEIMENVATYPEIIGEWAPNEKVAMEAASGAAIAGVRSMASMKHVGLNVAADPLFTMSYMGINAGFVAITADEPGQHSSQNEQDNRWMAKLGMLPMVEPANSQECKDMMATALEISEKWDTPILMRITTRVSHSKSLVEIGERKEVPLKPYEKNAKKFVCVPANSRIRRVYVDKRMKELAEYSETTPLNYIEKNSTEVGVIASGMAFFYAKEVFGDKASYLKLGFTNPLPAKKIAEFCKMVKKVYIIEENDPYIEDEVRKLGFNPIGKGVIPSIGELTPDVLRKAIFGEALTQMEVAPGRTVPRPPTLCAGCPHRGMFYELGKRKDLVIAGDIGCYSLGFAPPYNAMDFNVCMGAAFGSAHGAQKALDTDPNNKLRVVGVLGDSTFFHTGVNGLLEVAYNGSKVVCLILDNRITGMTGHQENPGSGFTAKGDPAVIADMEMMVKACGIKHIRTINPNDLKAVKEAMDWALALDEPSVIITRWPCVLKKFSEADKQEFGALFTSKDHVDHEVCIGCKMCLKSGCPAISVDTKAKKANIDANQCVGCDVCAQICPKKAIKKVVK